MQWICVIGHAGGSDHRGQSPTLQAIQAWCWWESMETYVKSYVKQCIHCLSTAGRTEPRPYGPALHATKPNEVLYFDYLALPEDEDTHSKYVLVIKDDFSGFVEGAHVKNAVIDTLACVLGAQHHFVTAYCPWANGTWKLSIGCC
ncbi:Retrotransposon protein [Phytophthora megakarya]|uniref:Retrotransposon protein n=1 Tax=Phytophthora megakarya TaxID=4795 RepID=A0A225W6S4_9STRA|nr:Retrotransposon protein [Phytophthora megakarya]